MLVVPTTLQVKVLEYFSLEFKISLSNISRSHAKNMTHELQERRLHANIRSHVKKMTLTVRAKVICKYQTIFMRDYLRLLV